MTLPFEVLLLDIEGTTTSISFVYDVLFPYARRAVEGFLEAHLEAVAAEVELLRQEAAAERARGEDAPEIPASGPREVIVAAAAASVRWQMDRDRKTTGLKGLQGKIWREGYASGELRGHVFEDVPVALRAAVEAGARVCIYSSGSVEAQRLLFGHAEGGELTGWLSGYFDTTTGPKREAGSYGAIAAALGVAPGAVRFVTDVLAEAEAAAAAGMQVRLSVRPGNPPQGEHGFAAVGSLTAALD